MLKRKLLMTVLPLLTAGVIVGTGFSAWEFSGVSLTDITTASVSITEEKYDQTTLTLNHKSLVLVLDQGGVDNANDVTKGIYFAESGSTGTAVTSLVASVSGKNTTDTTYTTVTFTIEITDTFKDYLVIPSTAHGYQDAQTAEVVVNLNSGETTATLTLGEGTTGNNFINYATGKKPITHDAYGTWKSTVEGLSGNAVIITATLS